MDAGTSTKSRLQGRQKATRLHGLIAFAAVSRHDEVFKKTPFVSGLHPVSRVVVKDIQEIRTVPHSTTTMLDLSVSYPASAASMTEKPTAVTRHFHQDVLRSAGEQTAASGDVVGVEGNRAIDDCFTVGSFDIGDPDGHLTGRREDAYASACVACATNVGSAEFATSARQHRFAISGRSPFGRRP